MRDTRLRDLVLPLVDAAEDSGQLPPIVQVGHPALRAQARPYDGELSPADLARLIEVMRRVMHAAPGVGLAAPQLGIPLQLAVLEDTYEVDPEIAMIRERHDLPFFAALNPAYHPLGSRTASFFEGCLSFTGYQAVVERAAEVELSWQSPEGASRTAHFHGWPARIVQHEVDHLNGTVYIDKAATRSLCDDTEYGRWWAAPTPDEARAGLGF